MKINRFNAETAAPVEPITQAQIERFLYSGIGGDFAETIEDAINKGYDLHSQSNYKSGIVPTPAIPASPKPAYLPVERKVRWNDLEDGCVLRWCGGKSFDYLRLTIGKEYTVKQVRPGSFKIEYDDAGDTGVTHGNWAQGGLETPWSFVSNPNYVHGFRIGETVYFTTKANAQYSPAVVVANLPHESRWVRLCLNGGAAGLAKPSEITRDPTKAYGYVAPVVTYKVYDGEVKAEDLVWWWGNDGPRQERAFTALYNVKAFPAVYSIAEPEFDTVAVGGFQTVKAYRYLQAPFNGDFEKYRASLKPDFASWQVGDILRFADNDVNRDAISFKVGEEVTFVCYQDGKRYAKTSKGTYWPRRFEWVSRTGVIADLTTG